MTDWKPVRLKRGRIIHVTAAEDMRMTACDWPCDGGIMEVDAAPTCKKYLRAMLDELN
jgi:hypothetical protein